MKHEAKSNPKAGGIGLNLAAASHVVHFDRCWNPAKEAQARA
jgi:SNF2 family DNA or RNA helicase